MKLHSFLSTLTAALGLTASAHAATIVQWGTANDIVTAQTAFVSGFNSSTINTSTPSNPTVGSSYYPSATGRNPVFYSAAYNNESASAFNTPRMRVQNDLSTLNNNDALEFSSNTVTATSTSTVLTLWTKTGSTFQNGFDTSNATLESMSLTGRAGSSSGATVRFVIQLGSDYYISDNLGSLASTQTTFSIASPGSTTWFSYSPTTDTATIGASASLSDFSDLNAVGFFWQRSANGTSHNVAFSNFNATAVPEPTTWALLAGTLTTLMIFRRRRRA